VTCTPRRNIRLGAYFSKAEQNAALGFCGKNEVKKTISAMFMHKIGYVLVNTVDSIIKMY
jgi:hypothetical protein